MNLALRRRIAAISVCGVAAFSIGVALAPSASAGAITKLSPAFGVNNNSSLTVTLTTQDLMNPMSRVVFQRSGASGGEGETITTFTDNDSPSKQPTVTIDLTDEGTGFDDGPANPGAYDVTITNGPADPFLGTTPPGATEDSCNACFTVFDAAPLHLTSVAPATISQGGEANATFT